MLQGYYTTFKLLMHEKACLAARPNLGPEFASLHKCHAPEAVIVEILSRCAPNWNGSAPLVPAPTGHVPTMRFIQTQRSRPQL